MSFLTKLKSQEINMKIVKEYPANTFCWLDLATPDAAEAKKFYTTLFGWSFVDMPTGPDMAYTMLQIEGHQVAGLYQQDADQQAQGIPPHWLSYVSVVNTDEMVEKAVALGGQTILPPFDVYEEGRAAILTDPTGAMFALWQPKNHIGAALVNQPRTLCWNELTTNDTAAAREFYCQLFDWESETQKMGNGAVYTSFKNNGRMAGGMMATPPEAGDMPPMWTVYLAVDDCDKQATEAKSLGGKILLPPTDIPGTGRFAVLQDPQGAVFTIINMVYADPPPGY